MNLKKQLQEIIDNAETFGISPIVMERAIIPSLIRIAKSLKHSHYYIWENQENQLVVTILQHKIKPNVQRRVILAFPTAASATEHPDFDPQTMDLVDADVTHLIFQILGIPKEDLDSLVFFSKKGNDVIVQEITCQDIKDLIQDKLKKLPTPPEQPQPNTRLV